MTYQLGHNKQELQRLERQAELYQDKQYFHLEKQMNVCEFGCGNGANLWIAEKIQDGQYIGFDSQAIAIDMAKEKANAMQLFNVTLYTADATSAPVVDNWSNFSFCRLVLLHNPEPRSILSEMVRVTNPGGVVLAIEPNNLSYLAYNKPFLNKTYHARVQYMYQPEKGTLDICPQLFHLFHQVGLTDITIKQHSIYYDSRNSEILKSLYLNWIVMLDTMKDELIELQVITQDEYESAVRESTEINEGDCIYQSLWIAEGKKPI
jgi:ubiquinone/menaquinone biosynthesis C-methylase UbiE